MSHRPTDLMEAASNCVGRKLLEGWTMHAKACDECLAPLMSHGATPPQCVNTGCSVCPSFSAPPSSSSSSAVASSSASSSTSPASNRSAPHRTGRRRQQKRKQGGDGDDADSGGGGGGGGSGGASGSEVLQRAKDRLRFALAKKLHAATSSLMEASDAREALAACEVLCRLGEAADALDT